MTDSIGLLSGIVAMGHALAGLFFLKFWRRSKDGLFLNFAIGFFLFATNQGLVGVYGRDADTSEFSYSLRLIGFLVIIFGIVRKNVRAST